MTLKQEIKYFEDYLIRLNEFLIEKESLKYFCREKYSMRCNEELIHKKIDSIIDEMRFVKTNIRSLKYRLSSKKRK